MSIGRTLAKLDSISTHVSQARNIFDGDDTMITKTAEQQLSDIGDNIRNLKILNGLRIKTKTLLFFS